MLIHTWPEFLALRQKADGDRTPDEIAAMQMFSAKKPCNTCPHFIRGACVPPLNDIHGKPVCADTVSAGCIVRHCERMDAVAVFDKCNRRAVYGDTPDMPTAPKPVAEKPLPGIELMHQLLTGDGWWHEWPWNAADLKLIDDLERRGVLATKDDILYGSNGAMRPVKLVRLLDAYHKMGKPLP